MSDSTLNGWLLRLVVPLVISTPIASRLRSTARRQGLLGLARSTPECRYTPHLSLSDDVTLSGNDRRNALAGRRWNCQATPQLSLTETITLSRKGRRRALAGEPAHHGSAPNVSRNALTNRARYPMRSRGKNVCHPGGGEVGEAPLHEPSSRKVFRHNAKG